MACYWIALIPLRCSGNQATILLEALVLMANLVDLMVGSIQLGLVSERGGGSFSFNPSIRSHKSTEAFKPKATVVSSLLLDYQAYYNQHYSPQLVPKSTHRSTEPTFDSHHRVIEFDSHRRVIEFDSHDHKIYSSHYIIVKGISQRWMELEEELLLWLQP